MSSTNRGSTRSASDYYVTPVPAIVSFLKAWSADGGPEHVRTILDPCAGGRIGGEGMSYPLAIEQAGVFPKLQQVTTLDIREDSQADLCGDYLTMRPVAPVDLIISNPPFSLAVEFVEKALRDVHHQMNWGGYVVMLQRLNFLGSEDRQDFWRAHMPYRIYVHKKRMGFLEHTMATDKSFIDWHAKPKNNAKYPSQEKALTVYRRQQDSIEYAHFVWWTGWKENHTPHLRLI